MKNPPMHNLTLETIALNRRAKIARFNDVKTTSTNAVAARAAGVSFPTIRRWKQRYAVGGLAALKPQYQKCGRPSQWSKIKLSKKAVQRLELLIAKTGSQRAGWVEFAKSPLCPSKVADYVIGTRHVPWKLSRVVRLTRLAGGQAFLSADRRRIFVRLWNGQRFMGRLTRI